VNLTRCESKINPDNNASSKENEMLYYKIEVFSPNTCSIIITMVLVGADIHIGGGDGMHVVQSLSSLASFAMMASLFFLSCA
jgi:hypothetical protein